MYTLADFKIQETIVQLICECSALANKIDKFMAHHILEKLGDVYTIKFNNIQTNGSSTSN